MDRADDRILDPANPLLSARLFRHTQRTADGLDTLHYRLGQFLQFDDLCHRPIELVGMEKAIYRFTETMYEMHRIGEQETARQFLPNSNRVRQIIHALQAESHLPEHISPPCWLGVPRGMKKAELPSPPDILPCRNGLVNLPAFIDAQESYIIPPTPLYFNLNALDYDFVINAPLPDAWLDFLYSLWKDDVESIETLQEWFGYCLTADTRQQKILLLYGPRRSGKGTLARILRALIGVANVCGPTLASLATNFGLWPLIGKSLAIISDARLSGKSDQSVIIERLLSISGEDALTIDQKNLPPITCKLPTRLAIMTNELPKLSDASGALSGRFLILKLIRSFYGEEDKNLTERLLKELPAILQWAIAGWQRLRTRGSFTTPESAKAAAAELDDLASPVMAFVRERCRIGVGNMVVVDDLYRAWVEWCTSQGRDHPGTVAAFGRDLGSAVSGVKRVQKRIMGVPTGCYEGIALGGIA